MIPCVVCGQEFNRNIIEEHLSAEITSVSIRYQEITLYKYGLQGVDYAAQRREED
jgi:phenylpyruvate tautomerase PptA (4-oxalocrotonate tautomerase family)